jgi:hypothetical protein
VPIARSSIFVNNLSSGIVGGANIDSTAGDRRLHRISISMPVRILLTSGGQRTVEAADSARMSGPFFMITRRRERTGELETLLTLRSQDVVGAEIVKDGLVTDYMRGGAPARER